LNFRTVTYKDFWFGRSSESKSKSQTSATPTFAVGKTKYKTLQTQQSIKTLTVIHISHFVLFLFNGTMKIQKEHSGSECNMCLDIPDGKRKWYRILDMLQINQVYWVSRTVVHASNPMHLSLLL